MEFLYWHHLGRPNQTLCESFGPVWKWQSHQNSRTKTTSAGGPVIGEVRCRPFVVRTWSDLDLTQEQWSSPAAGINQPPWAGSDVHVSWSNTLFTRRCPKVLLKVPFRCHLRLIYGPNDCRNYEEIQFLLVHFWIMWHVPEEKQTLISLLAKKKMCDLWPVNGWQLPFGFFCW